MAPSKAKSRENLGISHAPKIPIHKSITSSANKLSRYNFDRGAPHHYTCGIVHVINATKSNVYRLQTVRTSTRWDMGVITGRKKKRRQLGEGAGLHAARPAVHFSSINCNLSPRPLKNVVCNSDPVQRGTIEACVAPLISNTFHVPVTNSSATWSDEGWVKARWWIHLVSL